MSVDLHSLQPVHRAIREREIRLDCVQLAAARFGFEADPMQAEVLRSRSKRLLICCTRQWGKSTTAAALAAHRTLTQPRALILCVSPTLRQSAEFLLKVKGFLLQAGEKVSGGRLSLGLQNGSRVVALPGNEANSRGFSSPSLIVIDEAARVPDPLYHSLRPMLAVGDGDLALLSTPFGERGFFWKEWSSGGDHWKRIEVKATDCPRISARVLEEERQSQTAEWFAQEYLCSFVGMENQAFRKAWLEMAKLEGLKEEAYGIELKGGVK